MTTKLTQIQVTCAMVIATLLLAAPAAASIVVGPDGKPIRRPTMLAPERLSPIDAARAAPEPYVTALNSIK